MSRESTLVTVKNKKNRLNTVADYEREIRGMLHQVDRIVSTDDPLVMLVRGSILMNRALEYMLDEHLVEGLKPFELYRLGFAGETILARGVGLITRQEAAMVDAVRELRNAVAHRIDVIVTVDDEKRLSETFEALGFKLHVRMAPTLEVLARAMNPQLFTNDRPFKNLRYIIIYLVLLLNTRNGERPPGRIAEFAPPTGDDYATTRYESAVMMSILAPGLVILPKEQQDELFAQIAVYEYNNRAKRVGLPLAPNPSKSIAASPADARAETSHG